MPRCINSQKHWQADGLCAKLVSDGQRPPVLLDSRRGCGIAEDSSRNALWLEVQGDRTTGVSGGTSPPLSPSRRDRLDERARDRERSPPIAADEFLHARSRYVTHAINAAIRATGKPFAERNQGVTERNRPPCAMTRSTKPRPVCPLLVQPVQAEATPIRSRTRRYSLTTLSVPMRRSQPISQARRIVRAPSRCEIFTSLLLTYLLGRRAWSRLHAGARTRRRGIPDTRSS